MSVERYSPQVSRCDNSRSFKTSDLESEHDTHMESNSSGDYVEYVDYESLETENQDLSDEKDSLESDIVVLKSLLERIYDDTQGYDRGGYALVDLDLINEAYGSY